MKKDLAIIIQYIPQKIMAKHKARVLLYCIYATAIFSHRPVTPKDIKNEGKVNSSQGEPLVGVTVGIKNTTRSTTTDANGNFTLTAPENAVLK
jgi:hypothetical protein